MRIIIINYNCGSNNIKFHLIQCSKSFWLSSACEYCCMRGFNRSSHIKKGMKCKTQSQIQKLLSAMSSLHLSSSTVSTEDTKTNLGTELCLFVVTFPLLWERALPEGVLRLQLPDQVPACLGVLSTQVVFNEPADFNILYLTRRWFGPCSPAALQSRQVDCPIAFTTHCLAKRRQLNEGCRDWLGWGKNKIYWSKPLSGCRTGLSPRRWQFVD